LALSFAPEASLSDLKRAAPSPDRRPDAGGAPAARTRLLFLINDLARAGAETQLVELALALDPRAYEIEIVLLKHRNDFAHRLAEAGIPVIPLRRRGWWDVLVLYRLFRHLRRRPPDLLHSYLSLANSLGAVAGRLAGVPCLILSQRCSYEAVMSPFWRRVTRLAHRLADCLMVNSRAAFDEERAAGQPPDRIAYIPNGVRAEAPRPARPETLGLPPGPLVLSLGQLEAVKGHRFLLDAWPDVRRAHPRAGLALAGDGRCRRQLEARARALDLGDSVVFLGFRSPAAPLLAACDLLVQPSITEGMPNAVLEAMASGKAVVASRVGGIPELVGPDEAGLLVPPGDCRALAEAIVRLLDDPERRARLGAAGRRRVEERFSLQSTRSAVEAVYASVLAARHVP
jgi:glycosyltransferase involved in cell wall biosynthesis